MKGAEVYDDPTKDAWRGWKWNSIAAAAMHWRDVGPAERSRQLSTKTVLYLVGPEDHDRKRALARGFANHNIIAVDLVQDRIDEVRASGGFGIRGSLQQLLLSWPHDWPIDVIDADLCSGLVSNVQALIKCILVSEAVHSETVVSINLMRGRDQFSNPGRSSLKKLAKLGACTEEMAKHRGFNWMNQIIFFSLVGRSLDRDGTILPRHIELDGYEANELLATIWLPKYNSYKSKTSGQVFDSVVHRWGAKFQLFPGDDLSRFKKEASDDLSGACAVTEGVRQRIAALRAVRTMKAREAVSQ